jgi:hypothetical protein
MLQEFIRKASMNKSKYIDILSVHDLCHISSWMTIPTEPYYFTNFMHKGGAAKVFSTTFKDVSRHKIDLYAAPCCSITSSVCDYFRRMLTKHVITGKEVDQEKLNVILKTLSLSATKKDRHPE